MVIWIASYPRSGNTFFRMLVRYKFGRTTLSVFDHPRLFADGSARFIGHALPGPVGELADRPEVFFVKTHRVEDADSAYPAVYLVRDGRDSLVSCAHYQITFGGTSLSRAFVRRSPARLQRALYRRALRRMVIDRRFGGWSSNVRAWLERDAPTVVVRFEDLVGDPERVVAEALDDLEISLEETGEAVPTFETLQGHWPGRFRRGKVGSWRDEMPRDIHDFFWRRHGDTMRMLGYD